MNVQKTLSVERDRLLQCQCRIWATCGIRSLTALDLVFLILANLYFKNVSCLPFLTQSLLWCLVGCEFRDVVLNPLSTGPERGGGNDKNEGSRIRLAGLRSWLYCWPLCDPKQAFLYQVIHSNNEENDNICLTGLFSGLNEVEHIKQYVWSIVYT